MKRLLMLLVCAAPMYGMAQLEPIVNESQIKRHGIRVIKVKLFNADSLGHKHGEGELERYYEYDPMGNVVERNIYPEEANHNRTTIYEYKKGHLWRESVNKAGNLVQSVEYKTNAAGIPTQLTFANGTGQVQAIEEMDYAADTLLMDYRMYNDEKELMLVRKYEYLPGTHLLTKEVEERGGYKRTMRELKYNAKKQVVEEKVYDNTGALKHVVTNEYDANNNRTKQITRKPDGELEEELTFIYNKSNQLVEEFVKHEGITLRDSRQYIYDERGLHKQTLAFEATTHHWRIIEIVYEYHKQ